MTSKKNTTTKNTGMLIIEIPLITFDRNLLFSSLVFNSDKFLMKIEGKPRFKIVDAIVTIEIITE